MKTKQEQGSLSRREFLRFFPRHLLDKAGVGPFRSSEPEDRAAQVEISRCHAWMGMSCQQCYLACPRRDQAIEMRDQKPVVILSACDGCALCEEACRTVNDLPAIRMVRKLNLSKGDS